MTTFFERWIGAVAARVIRREQPTIIAVTGSVGKSSTKNAVGIILDAADPQAKVRVSIKNYNNELGVPLTILGLRAPGRSPFLWVRAVWTVLFFALGWKRTGIKTFVLEMGADKPGDLAYLTRIAPPSVGLVTAVTPEDPAMAPVHAANYASIDAMAAEKATLVEAVRVGGTAILNADDERVRAMRALTKERVYTFGQTEGADVRLVGTRMVCEEGEHGNESKGIEISVESFNRLRKIFLPGVFGKPIAYAVCAALTVSAILDNDIDESLGRLKEKFRGLPGRTRIIPGIKYTTLLDDSYNASPVAVLSALRDLAQLDLKEGQRRVACLGEMRELGEQSEALHRLVGAEAAKLNLDLLVVCGTLAHVMAEGARGAGMADDRIKIFDDTPEAGLFLQEWIKPGDVVLAKASEGPHPSSANWNQVTGVRMERIIKELMADPARAGELLVRQEEAWGRR